MTGDCIALEFDALREHAHKVQQAADELDDPIGAIAYTTLGSDAYGLMCSFAALPTTALGVGAGASLVATRELLKRSAQVMELVVDSFEEHETQVCTDLDGVAEGIPV